MGFSTHRFVGTVDPNLLCGICSSVIEDAVLTPCGHSFCYSCLETWMSKPRVNSCPECRHIMTLKEAKPVLCIRNLVNGFDVMCDNSERGCKVVVKLERLKPHLEVCGYTLVKCAGCSDMVSRSELANHQMTCDGIAASLKDENYDSYMYKSMAALTLENKATSIELSGLLAKISSLEFQLKTLKRDLQISESKNRVLEREYRKTKDELQQKRNEILDVQYAEFDPDYDYGYTPQSVAKLSLLIARFLLKKPSYVDSDKIFAAVKRSYDQYARCGSQYEHDVHMLVATAFASDWFSESQRINFHCWLQSIARHRQYSNSGMDSCEHRIYQ
uniref:RING-type domain-containing protein n=1 Tax=Magallana gigas TaxID=29159 RepID=A0A8W8HY05_MAGGI|nr:E3 ubiquitin-protein ligase PDZRN3-B-like [Crassostrea gigas]